MKTPGDAMSTVISASLARSRLGEVLTRVAGGEEVIISRRGKPTVTLRAVRKRVLKDQHSKPASESPSQLSARLSRQLGDHFQLNSRQQARLESLAKKSKCGSLTAGEDEELNGLLAEYDRMTLLRARALSEMK